MLPMHLAAGAGDRAALLGRFCRCCVGPPLEHTRRPVAQHEAHRPYPLGYFLLDWGSKAVSPLDDYVRAPDDIPCTITLQCLAEHNRGLTRPMVATVVLY